MKLSLLLSTTAYLTTLVAGLGLDPQPSAGPRSFAQTRRHRRRLGVDFGLNGTTPEEVCDSILENWYAPGFPEAFQTTCTCEPRAEGGFSASCTDFCEYCQDGACSRFSSTLEINAELEVEKLQGCDDFSVTSFDGETVCYTEDYSTPGVTALEYFVDDQKCASADYVDCPSIDSVVPLVDCFNLGYGDNMNFCAEATLTGPFGFQQDFFFSTVDDYAVGACTPSSCQEAFDAAAACNAAQLPQRSQACGECVLEAVDTIFNLAQAPSDCLEANDAICSIVGQCDSLCLSCQDEVEDFTECMFEETAPLECDFECGTTTSGATFPMPLLKSLVLTAMVVGYFV